jgi:S-adenosylmethionine:tRNA ribosyltransferase-isomerase
MIDIDMNDYDYDLPADRIAQYPVKERDKSLLLVYRDSKIVKDVFSSIPSYLPTGSLLVFNNTRVIRARLLFQKTTGAVIEILCLEPLNPEDYFTSFDSKERVEWKCIIGNLKKWKSGRLTTNFNFNNKQHTLYAERIMSEGEAWRIKFSWNNDNISFREVLGLTGHIPLPPYINREDDNQDALRYQTVYSRIDGSVAAPTAGLHFTEKVLYNIENAGLKKVELTLHVGAGTFQPVKADNLYEHEMHCEHFSVKTEVIESLIEYEGKVIPVGTTSVRTLESLYWLGAKYINSPISSIGSLSLGQWEAYKLETTLSVKESLEVLLRIMKMQHSSSLEASTSIMIVPGYEFRITSGMVTNFHQPRSTLLLLVSAWTGIKWRDIYKFALDNGFRFLSYGDSSLLLK